jgi:aryl-alcohol dehydrogenase-like predicted oxidoreductase
MEYVQLGSSDLVVSKVCMGTMTMGNQNTLEEGVEQLTRAWDHYGINFLDTAEIYPVPTDSQTQGRTDRVVAQFLKTRQRSDVILATKVAGRSEGMKYLPRRKKNTPSQVTAEQIVDSIDASLQRLETDYIDLLQIHWPDRYTGGLFGQADFSIEQYESSPTPNSFQVIQSGKVRYVGVSNETPYGIGQFCALAQAYPDLYPRIVSIQNSYSLVVRKDYEAGLAESCYHHNVGLLAYSPLAGGTLTGKYRSGPVPGARLTLFPGYMKRYLGSRNEAAVAAYCDIAEQQAKLTPTQLALAWCYRNPLVTSTIVGATSLAQLDENIQAYDVRLKKDVMQQIQQVYREYTDPTKA